MKNTSTTILMLLISGFTFGTVFGFIFGVYFSTVSDVASAGAITLAEIQLLEAGETDKLKEALEYKIDNALVLYSNVDEAWWAPLYEHGYLMRDAAVDRKYIRRIANYRKANPGPYQQSIYKKTGTANTVEEAARIVERMSQKYAD